MEGLPVSARAGAGPILIVAHASATASAAELARSRWPGSAAALDVLAYGRAGNDLPLPASARRITLPGRRIGVVLHWLAGLRRRGYAGAVVAQPGLARNFMRGPLLAFPHLAGASEVLALDPASDTAPQAVPRSRAIADLVAWLGWRALARPASWFGAATARVLGRMPSRAAGQGTPALDGDGAVLYLRTDLELAAGALETGGSAAHTLGVVAALRRRGRPVHYWATGEVRGMPPDVPRSPLPVTVAPNVPTELAEFVSGLRQGLTPRKPDGVSLVYQRYSLNNVAGVMLARRWDVPLVVEANASEVEWRRAAGALRYSRLGEACERLVLGGANRVVTVSDNAAETIRSRLAEPGRLKVVPNGVEQQRFAAARPRALPFGDDALIVGFAGLFYPWHGVRTLAGAFARMHDERPAARLVLVGDGEDRAHVEAILAERGKAEVALLAGSVPADDVPSYLASFDIAATPHTAGQDFIGSPVKVFEYMAAGRAIVASNIAQIGQILRDEETALLVPPGDEEQLAEALVRLHDDAALRTRLGQAAAVEAAREHSWDARVAEILT